jgi:hypothetical protein
MRTTHVAVAAFSAFFACAGCAVEVDFSGDTGGGARTSTASTGTGGTSTGGTSTSSSTGGTGGSGTSSSTGASTTGSTSSSTGGTGGSGTSGTLKWTETKGGNPLWRTAGWQLFSGTVGFASDHYLEGQKTVASVWPKHVFSQAYNVVAPAIVHLPPYDDELPAAMTAAGFSRSLWVSPAGLFFSGVVVPLTGAPEGKTADGPSLPMIPDTINLVVDAALFENGVPVDPNFNTAIYPKAATLAGDGTVQGFSHMPVNFFENTDWISGAPGSYLLEVAIYEQATGAGYKVSLGFTIVP